MVIQRLQSVLLLIAVAAMVIFAWVPFGIGVNDGVELVMKPLDYSIVTFILSWVAAALFLIDIFLFKNFKAQKSVLGLGLLVTIVTGGFAAYYNIAASTVGYAVTWAAGCWMVVVAVVFAVWARKRICHDERLLRSSDRLR